MPPEKNDKAIGVRLALSSGPEEHWIDTLKDGRYRADPGGAKHFAGPGRTGDQQSVLGGARPHLAAYRSCLHEYDANGWSPEERNIMSRGQGLQAVAKAMQYDGGAIRTSACERLQALLHG